MARSGLEVGRTWYLTAMMETTLGGLTEADGDGNEEALREEVGR